MNPVDLWAMWMKGWLKVADALVDIQRQYVQHGAGMAGAARRGADRAEHQVREMTETLARMQQDLAMAGARPAAAPEASPPRPKPGPKPGARKPGTRKPGTRRAAAGTKAATASQDAPRRKPGSKPGARRRPAPAEAGRAAPRRRGRPRKGG